MQAPERQGSSGKHLVIAVHGIRTFGDWQERLGALLRPADPSVVVRPYKYGYFSALAFVFPPARLVETSRLRSFFRRLAREQQWDRIDIVAHSFGTHIVGHALLGMNAGERPAIHTIILAGSVLKSTFPWDELIGSGVGRVVNECGARDSILLLSHFFAIIPPFTGMAGRVGFYGLTGEQFVNRFYRFGHSDYFVSGGKPSDGFMRDNWVALLTTDQPVQPADERGRLNAFHGLWMFVANNSGPFKLALAAALLVAPWLYYKSLYEDATMRLVDSLIAQGDTQVSLRDPAQARGYYAEARRNLRDLGKETVPADLALYHAFQRLQHPLQVADRSRTAILKFAVAPDSRVAVTYNSGGLQRWNLLTGLESGPIAGCEGRLMAVGIARKGAMVVVGTAAGVVMACQLESGTRSWSSISEGPVITTMAVSRDGDRIAVGDGSGRIRIFEATTGAVLASLASYKSRIEALAFSPDAGRLLSAASDGSVRLWRLKAPASPHLLQNRGRGKVSIAFATSGREAMIAGRNEVGVWDADTGRFLGSQVFPSSMRGAAEDRPVLSTDGRYLAASIREPVMVGASEQAQYEELELYSLHLSILGLREGVTVFIDRLWALPGYAAHALDAVFPADGATVLFVTRDNRLELWDIQGSREPRRLPFGGPFRRPGISKDGRLVLAPEPGGAAGIWDTATLTKLRTFAPAGRSIVSVALTPDGALAATGAAHGEIKVWDTRVEAELATINAHTVEILALAIAPDGKQLVSIGADGAASAWALPGGVAQHRLSDGKPRITDASFSPNSRWIALSASDGTLSLWDARKGRRERAFEAHKGGVFSVAFSSDGEHLVSAGADQLIRSWDPATGKPTGRAESASRHAHAAFLSSSRWALSGGVDRAVKLWDLAGGKMLYGFPVLPEGHASIAVARGGATVITASAYSQNLLWTFDAGVTQLELDAALEGARTALRRNPRDAGALDTLGRWYSFRGRCEWAAQLFEAAGLENMPEASWPDRFGCFAAAGRHELARAELRRIADRRVASGAYVDLWERTLDAGSRGHEEAK